jgi:hypothetical protein
MASFKVDIASERLILQLGRADVEIQLRDSQLAPERDMLTDRCAAIDLQLQELARLEDTYAGQRMQQSMYVAMLADSNLIADQRRLEEQAIADRVAASAAVGLTPPPIPTKAHEQVNSGNYDDVRLTQLEEAGLSTEASLSDDGSTEAGGSLSLAETRTSLAEDNEDAAQATLESYINALRLDEDHAAVDCDVCTTSFQPSQTMTLPCGDTWCRSCIARRYQEATVNEGAWPVTCCRTEIAMDKVRHLLPLDLRTRFASKSIEWSDTDRIYCHEPSCSTYIPHSTTTENLALCSVCRRETCAQCKGPYHVQQLCPDDTTGCDLLAETARANGWPKCPGCRRYVEITHGCNHIT